MFDFTSMKLLAAFFLLLPLTIFGQDKVFTLKPSFGINACQIHGDTYTGFNKAGIFSGLGLNARLNEKTSLELGFYFSQKGSRHNPNYKTGDYTYFRLNLNYVDLPISFRYVVNSYFLTFGPSIAYLISYKEESSHNSFDGQYNSFETGLNIGLGRIFANGFSVEARNSNSITPIRTIKGNLIYYTNPIARFFNKGFYSNMITVMLTYTIAHKKKNAEP